MDVIRDIYAAPSLPAGFAGQRRDRADAPPEIGQAGSKFSQGLPKTAPASSLAARQSPDPAYH